MCCGGVGLRGVVRKRKRKNSKINLVESAFTGNVFAQDVIKKSESESHNPDSKQLIEQSPEP